MANSRSGPRTTVSCHSGPGLTTLVLMLSQDQHGNAIVVLKPSWSSHTGSGFIISLQGSVFSCTALAAHKMADLEKGDLNLCYFVGLFYVFRKSKSCHYVYFSLLHRIEGMGFALN